MVVIFQCCLRGHAPLAQLDRASGYGPEGQEFESLTARHKKNTIPRGMVFFLYCTLKRDANSLEFVEAVQNARKHFGTVKSRAQQIFLNVARSDKKNCWRRVPLTARHKKRTPRKSVVFSFFWFIYKEKRTP